MKFLRAPALLLLTILPLCAAAQNQFSALVYAMPSKYHYEYIPFAKEAFRQLAVVHQFGLTWASDPSCFDGDLSKFDVIVFLDTQADALNEKQRENFVNYIHGHGGFVAVHKAIGEEAYWPWFAKLIGRTFVNHPMIQTAVVKVEAPDFPAAIGLPPKFLFSDEWYITKPVEGVTLNYVLSVDESTYDVHRVWTGFTCEEMGFHPEAWYHEFEGARSFTSALGHIAEDFTQPRYLEHLYGGIWWAAQSRIAAKQASAVASGADPR